MLESAREAADPEPLTFFLEVANILHMSPGEQAIRSLVTEWIEASAAGDLPRVPACHCPEDEPYCHRHEPRKLIRRKQ